MGEVRETRGRHRKRMNEQGCEIVGKGGWVEVKGLERGSEGNE